MKKIYMCIISLMGFTMQAQQQQFQGVNYGDTPHPVPSLTSFATFTDNPPALAKGKPEISVPLLSIPGYGGSGIGLQLNYDPINTGGVAGETGAGWLMSKGGVISRKINGIVDELFQYDEERFNFDDEYYYNLPGFSGKFKITRNIQQNTFTIIDLNPLNHVKIAYTKQNNPNPKTLLVDSFTITDDQGNTYHFNDYSIAVVYDGFYESKGLWGTEYKSAFYLTKITNTHGVETASFTYKKETKKNEDDWLVYISCQLEKINTASGNIEIVYDYDQALQKTMNDPYSIKKLILSNAYAKTAEYTFEYSYPFPSGSVESKTKIRQLNRIKKMDGQTVVEETSFVYHPLTSSGVSTGSACDGSQVQNPLGVLSKIIYPTKGVTEFIYEGGEVYKDKSSAEFLESLNTDYRDGCAQSIAKSPPLNFDTRQAVTYTFTVSGDPARKRTFWLNFNASRYHYTEPRPIDPNTGFPTPRPPLQPNQRLSYTLQRGSEVLVDNERTDKLQFYNYPGQYTITVNIPYVEGSGTFILSELVTKPGPYRNATGGSPYRIKSVKRYADAGSSTPVHSVTYAYDSFSLPNSSSGYHTYDGVMYKNVKVTEDTAKGYTQYEFKLSDSYPSYPYVKDGIDGTFRPYYNLVRSGILEKKEVYSESGKLLSRDNFEYTLALENDVDYPISGNNYSKAAYFSQTKNSSVVYPSGSASSFLASSSETNVRADNFKPSSSKSVSADGTTTESFYQYAQDKNHTKLLAANMTGIPLESEVKENGKTIGKSETRFDHATNLYPTSEISYNRQTQSPVTTSTFDVYDNKGNLVQATGKNGIPSTTIWGYHQTMPIAVISGASYSQVASLASVTAAVAASNADCDNPANEPALLQALETLRKDPALKDYGVTASTYDPLIGVTNSISGNGIRTVNVYDSVGRLIKVTDAEGKTLQENQYNYKH
ncbi:hypothetical protein [Chryseobacterium vrystaatense]|nr:hypothetical protein [Chryseobacterium vrystaatense]